MSDKHTRPESLDEHLTQTSLFYNGHPICTFETNMYKNLMYTSGNVEKLLCAKPNVITLLIAHSGFGGMMFQYVLSNKQYLSGVDFYIIERQNNKNMYVMHINSMECWDIMIHDVLKHLVYKYSIELTRDFIKYVKAEIGGVTYQKESKWYNIFEVMRSNFIPKKPGETGISFTEKDSYMEAKILKNLGLVQFYSDSKKQLITINLANLFVFRDDADEKMLNVVGQTISTSMFL